MKPIDDKEFAKVYGKMPIEVVAKKFGIVERTVLRKAKLLGLTRKQKVAAVKREVKRETAVQVWQEAEIWAQHHLDLYREAMSVLGTLKAISKLAKGKIQTYANGKRKDGLTLTWIDQLKNTEAMFITILNKLTEFEEQSLSKELSVFKQTVMEALKDETPEAFEKVRIRLAGLAPIHVLPGSGDANDRGSHSEEIQQPAEPPAQQQDGGVVA